MAQTKTLTITSYILSGLFVLFMIFDITIKLMQLPIVATTMQELGWAPAKAVTIGAIELICVALYVYPRTAVLGAVLMMGVLGGAVATHLRIDSPLFSHDLFGVYLGLFMWGGLWLRDEKLRGVFPYRGR